MKDDALATMGCRTRPLTWMFVGLFIALGSAGCQGRERGAGDPVPEMEAETDAGMEDAATPSPPMPTPPPESDAGPSCTPDCAGRACGDDGCGGSCGACGGGDACVAGRCEASCPPNASPTGDGECACDPGHAISADCTGCIVDGDGDGCPPNASPSGGSCYCDAGYGVDGCACIAADTPPPPPPPSPCGADEAEWCGSCVSDPDGDGCPSHASPSGGTCACDAGWAFDASGCECLSTAPDFTHPAFEATSCTGPTMTHAAAEMRWSRGDDVLGPYQIVFRRRDCDASDVCGPWTEIPLTEITWRTRASGILKLGRFDGVMKLDVRYGLCDGSGSTQYNEGARCTGVGAALVCDGYRYPHACDRFSDRYHELLGRRLYFDGELKEHCARLVADVATTRRSDGSYIEAQAGLLVRF